MLYELTCNPHKVQNPDWTGTAVGGRQGSGLWIHVQQIIIILIITPPEGNEGVIMFISSDLVCCPLQAGAGADRSGWT